MESKLGEKRSEERKRLTEQEKYIKEIAEFWYAFSY